MYVPAHFAEHDLTALDRLAARDSFGTLISVVDGAPFATHLPVLYRREDEQVRLTGHWARPNQQWRDIEAQRVMFIFHGPHAYISPRWYTDPSRQVPTWNYTTAHVYGRIRLIEGEGLTGIVSALSEIYERNAVAPWRFEPSESAARLRGIVGFELTADHIEIKLKLSQNQTIANAEGAIAGLTAEGGDAGAEVASAMQEALERRKDSAPR